MSDVEIDEDDDEVAPALIFVDGVVRVQAGMCDTCIFRPGNRMDLMPGRVDQMVSDCLRDEGVIPCHKTLGLDKQAICHGFFARYWSRNWMLRLAKRDGIVQEIPL